MKEIKDLTQGDLFHLTNLATGGYFNMSKAETRKEIEVGGYDKRRRVQWISHDGDELEYFEITSENSDGWAWHCKCLEDVSESNKVWHTVNTIAPHRLVDYLRKKNFNIDNGKE